MAFTILDQDTVSATTVDTVGSNDDLYILPGVDIVVTGLNAPALRMDPLSAITVAGSVYGGSVTISDNNSSSGGEDKYEINVLPSGLVASGNETIWLDETGAAFVTLNNAGTIQGRIPAYLRGDVVSVTNTGLISSTGTGTVGTALIVQRKDSGTGTFDISNSGTIAATNVGDSSAYGLAAVRIENGNAAQFFNSGQILSDLHGVRFDFVTTVDATNTGLIQNGIQGLFLTSFTLNNAGTITAFQGQSLKLDLVGTARVINSGEMQGDVDLTLGDDTYRAVGEGVVTGDILGEDGNDLLLGGALDDRMSGGADMDTIRGRAGDDELTGNAGDDTISGGEGNDTVNGGTENDFLFGDAGDDVILGAAGDDFARGGDGADTINGSIGNDWFYGGFGNDSINGEAHDDRLYGEQGDDTIIGGAGRDVIYSGDGLDVIVFNDASESAVGALRDVIYDFEPRADLIDLASVAPGLLDFRGAGAFTGTARELRLIEAGGSTRVQVDVDADGTVDMEIFLKGVVGLTADDFVL